MNFDSLLKAKQAWNSFCANHPRFPDFLRAVKDKGICEGCDIEIAVKYPDGEVKRAGIHVKQSDLELIALAGSLMR